MDNPDFSTIPGLIADIETDSDGTILNQHEARTGQPSEVVIVPLGGEAGRILIWNRKLTEAEKDQVEQMIESLQTVG